MTDYNAMTIVKLKGICKERGIPYANINKAGIVKALNEADATEKPGEEVSEEVEASQESGEEGSEDDGSEESEEVGGSEEGSEEEGSDVGSEEEASEEEEEEAEEEAPPPKKTKPLKAKKGTPKPTAKSSGGKTKEVTTPKKTPPKKTFPKKTSAPKKASSPKKVSAPKVTLEKTKPKKTTPKVSEEVPSPKASQKTPQKTKLKKATPKVSEPASRPRSEQADEVVRVSDVKGALEAVRNKLDLYAKRSDTEYRRLSQLLSSARPEAYRAVFENFLITDSVRTCSGSLAEHTRKALEDLHNKVLEEVLGGFLNHSKITYLPEVGAFVDQGYAYVVGDKALVFGRVEGTSVLPLSDKDLAKFAKDEVWHLVSGKPLPNAKMIATLIANTVAPLGTPEGSEEGSEEEDGQAESQVAAELEVISRKRPGRKEWVAYVKAQRSLKGDASANYKTIAAEAKIPEASARYIASNYTQLQAKYAKKA